MYPLISDIYLGFVLSLGDLMATELTVTALHEHKRSGKM